MGEEKTQMVGKDMVVSMEYTLTVDGEVLDSSEKHGPIEFLQGHQNIIPGLEMELNGMQVGESKQVVVAAKDGYGLSDPEEIKDIDKGEFPDEVPLKPGVNLEMKDDEGDLLYGTIVEVGDDTVKMDFNHPLADKELHFEVKIAGLREATQEELAHGHVHSHGHHH
jgi:FKBP-type peptidyl-prolyl cis-trans isomerase SlyD